MNNLNPNFAPIEIVFEDEHFLVVNKPADLLTVPGRGPDKQDCLINRLLINQPNARIVHRLDMATSGLVIIALSHSMQSQLSQLFAKRQIEKTYIAIVSGRLEEQQGLVDLPLICDWDKRPKQKVDHEHGKSAQTHYCVNQYYNDSNSSRVTLSPITGRSHQLRVHMQALGHPILGDYFYATEAVKSQSTRLLLHATQLKFKHPITEENIMTTAEAPF